MQRKLSRSRLALVLASSLAILSASTPAAEAQSRSGTKRNPRVYYTHSPPHAPNLMVVARAIALDAAMRAAGLSRIAPVATEVTPGAPGQLYTENELEARTQRTRIDPGAQLVPALREAWPEIGELGARTLAAQFSIETGAGSHCYNFNLGNHKAGSKEPHMYLRGVWEGVGRGDFERMHRDATFGELVREESTIELRKSGHVVPPGKIVVLLDPPHPAARFRANATLELGVTRFAALHRRIGERNEMYLSALRAGDSRSVARILGSPSVGYFTGNVDAYAQGMMNHRDIIDEGLGPPTL